jgi:hypothetical protein
VAATGGHHGYRRSVSVPGYLERLVDDAAIFPPAATPLDAAVAAHLEHRRSEYAGLVGRFVVDDRRLPELATLTEQAAEPVEVTVVVSGGAGALEPAAVWASRSPGLRLTGLEIALRDEEDLAHNARRVVAAVDQLGVRGLLEEVLVFVEAPRLFGHEPSHSWLSALDEIAAMDHVLKLRTGGVDAEAFPDSAELATCIEQALDRELRFKCTAGLHHALRHRDTETGFEHHGFLNVLRATRASLDGAGPTDLADVLDATEPPDLTDHQSLESARRWFTGFGSCSISDPVADLRALGVLPARSGPA